MCAHLFPEASLCSVCCCRVYLAKHSAKTQAPQKVKLTSKIRKPPYASNQVPRKMPNFPNSRGGDLGGRPVRRGQRGRPGVVNSSSFVIVFRSQCLSGSQTSKAARFAVPYCYCNYCFQQMMDMLPRGPTLAQCQDAALRLHQRVQPNTPEGEATGRGPALCLSLRLRCDPRGWQRG